MEVSRQAVELTPQGHRERARHLANPASALRVRYEQTGAWESLDEAATAAAVAAAEILPDDPQRANVTLAAAQPDLAEPALLKPAIQAYRDAALAPGASPAMQVRAAAEGGRLAAACGEMRTAIGLLDRAVSALENVAPSS